MIEASGHSVGLPDGQMGNSEVGHMATGKGLSNIAPTVLQLMGLEKPEAMTATSLLLKPILH